VSGALRDRIVAAPVLSDPDAAAERLAELPGLKREPKRVRALLAGIAEHSPFLWQIALRDPKALAHLLDAPPEEAAAALVADQAAAGRPGEGGAIDLDAVGARLRRNRATHALLVALADIGGAWDLDAVTGSLSDFADASVSAALDALLGQAATAGRFLPPDPAHPQAGSGLVVLGLGKLGARELNYSSDIDLIVFFDPERVPLREGVEPTPFFSRLAQGMGRLLQDRTGEGYVHRVDYRLRPDPGSTPTAMSLNSAYVYYETLGQNWERAAFIKARAIARSTPCAGTT